MAPCYQASAAEQGPVLSLQEAVGIARSHSLNAIANRERLASDKEQREVTAATALPSVSLGTGATYSVLPSGSNGVGNGLSGFPVPGTYVDSSARVSQPIFDAFNTRDALTLADQQIAVSQLAVVAAEQDAMRDVAVDYLQTLRAKGLADVAADSVSQAQEHLRLGISRLHAGTGTRGDVLQLEAELANAQASYLQSQNAVTLARLTLATALAVGIDDRPLLPKVDVPVVEASPGNDLAGGLSRREEVREAELKVASDRTRADQASRGNWPTVNGSSNYSQRGLAQGNFSASLNASWPVFDGDKTRHQVASAQHDIEADLAALKQARLTVALDIRTNYNAQQEAIARVATTRRGLASAREAYHIALSRYRAGLSTLYELVDVQATLIQARGNYVQATIDQEVAAVKLARALGRDLAAFLGVKK